MTAFEELGVCPEIIRAIGENGWTLPTPVQAEAIPLILGGGDLCVAAETGSGKTGAFGLPCLQVVHETLRNRAIVSGGPAVTSTKLALNPNDKHPFVTISEDGMECRSSEGRRWNGVRATVGVFKGKYMFEVYILSEGLVRVGWSTQGADLALGTDESGFGYGGTAKKSWNAIFEDYGETFSMGDTIGCLVDRTQEIHTISFAKNGIQFDVSHQIAKASPAFASDLRPHICGKEFAARLEFDNMQYPMEGFEALGKMEAKDTLQGATHGIEVAGKNQRHPLCVVLEPTKDLAMQTYKCMAEFGAFLDAPQLRIGLFVGGINEKKQHMDLQRGVDVCVGTLQRIVDFERKGKLDVSNVRFLVLDEADDLMKNDDKRDIPRLKEKASRGRSAAKPIQTLFFSATLHSPEVATSIDRITVNPTWVDLKGKPTVPDTVHFATYLVDATFAKTPFEPVNNMVKPILDGVHDFDRERDNRVDVRTRAMLGHSARTKYLKPMVAVKIADELGMANCLVFCRTNLDCDNFEKYLTALGGGRGFSGQADAGKENPYSCVVLAGMRQQEERQQNLQHFKNGDVRFLVCTDVAARGIDIQELPFLMMLTLPDDPFQFFHRVGRVGRADRMGLAIAIASTEKEKVWYHKCPNRGRGCTNVDLIEHGGCTIWYDEPAYLKAIEDVIGIPIPKMHKSNFSIPGILDTKGSLSEKVQAGEDVLGRRAIESRAKEGATTGTTAHDLQNRSGALMIYGKDKGDAKSKTTSKHLERLAPAVGELQALEKEIQRAFVTLAEDNQFYCPSTAAQ